MLPGGMQAPQEETSLCALRPKSVLSRTPTGRVYKTAHTNAAPQGPCTGPGTHVKALGSRPLLAPLLYENPGGGGGGGGEGRVRGELPGCSRSSCLYRDTNAQDRGAPALKGPCTVFLIASRLQLSLIP